MVGVVAVLRFHVAAELLLGDTVVREFFHSELENFMAWHGMHRGESKWSLQEDAAAAEDNACYQSLAQKDCQHLCVQVIERKQH